MKKQLLLIVFVLTCTYAGAQVYSSQNISMLSNWFDPAVLPEPVYSIKYNGVWGWDDGNGNEYALVGSTAGTYFVNVTNPAAPVVADFVAGRRNNCIWREIKTYTHYAYLISDDGSPNSFQIVDLQYLPDSVHVVYDNDALFERAHTLFVDGNKLYCASVKGGVFPGQSSMAVFSLVNPELPFLLRSLNNDFSLPSNSVHDMFVRNDTVYASCGFDGLFLFKFNSSTNQFSLINSLTTYPQQGYNHSSALTDDSQTLVFMDEVPDGLGVKLMDVSNLSNLTVNRVFHSNTGATPHNPFVVGNTCYIAYYQDGLYVYDISNPAQETLLGYFDTHHQTPLGSYQSPAYAGAWGAYPFLPSGRILVSDMQNGLYVLDASAIQGIQEKSQNAFSLYPNPAENGSVLNYTFIEPKEGTFTLRDVAGRFISDFNVERQLQGKLQLPDCSGGVYFLEFRNNDGGVFTRRVTLTR